VAGNGNADKNATPLSKKPIRKLPTAIAEYFSPTGVHALGADGAAERAHWAQIQALRCASAGTDSSNAASKTAVVHQQGGWGMPVSRSISLAHWLGCPHNGQRLGSIAIGEVGIKQA